MSLRLRLALWYGVLTGLIVLLVGLFAYGEHARMGYEAVDRDLVAAVEHLAGVHGSEASAHELSQMVAVALAPGQVVRILGPGGEVVAMSPGGEQAPTVDPEAVLTGASEPAFDPVAALAPGMSPPTAAAGQFGLVTGTDGERWRVYAQRLVSSGRTILAVAPLGNTDREVELFRRYIALLTLLAVGLSLTGASFVARNALRPVAVLTETAGAIARSRGFGKRVPVGSRRDELGQLAATFNEMLASLEQAYQAEQRFVGDASHELRAPLTAIQANLELLERQPQMPASERLEAVSEASREAHRLSRLVADLLALARADAGLPLRFQPVELDRVLLQALADGRQLAREQRVEVAELEPALVEGDPDRLRQLLLILVDNAVKYTPRGGQVTLGLHRHGSQAEVRVQDTGIGIPPENVSHVFERFYRADPARARDPGGTGLGLSIAHWIVEQHRGEIRLDSQPDRGTIVTVRLPLAP